MLTPLPIFFPLHLIVQIFSCLVCRVLLQHCRHYARIYIRKKDVLILFRRKMATVIIVHNNRTVFSVENLVCKLIIIV